MAELPARRHARIIDNFNMQKPASDPLSDDESEGLAQSAVLSGSSGTSAIPTNQQVTTTLGTYASSLYEIGLGGNYI